MEPNNKNEPKVMDLNDVLGEADSSPEAGTGIKFEENIVRPVSAESQKPSSWMAGFLIKHSNGIIKDDKQANFVLVVIVVVLFVITAFVIFGGGGGMEEVPLPVE